MTDPHLSESQLMQNWKPIIDLTTQMQELAKQEDWQAVTKLDSERQQLIQAFFNQPIPPQYLDRVRVEIEKILQIDQQLMQSGKLARDNISMQLSQFIRNRQAHNAYKSNSGTPE